VRHEVARALVGEEQPRGAVEGQVERDAAALRAGRAEDREAAIRDGEAAVDALLVRLLGASG
jgi:hypothetical protein